MGVVTAISWCDATFNPVRGCTKVSPGCLKCYAERDSKRFPDIRGTWGPNGTRVVAAESGWREPIKWNRIAAGAGVRRRVFCASLADWLEDWRGDVIDSHGNRVYVPPGPTPWESYSPGQAIPPGRVPLTYTHVRARLISLIVATPSLDWLLLSKRPEGFSDRLHEVVRETHDGADSIASGWLDGFPPSNVVAMTTVENQEYANTRVPWLFEIPALRYGLSVEPQLEHVDLSEWTEHLHWIISGGESGAGARPFDVEWARDLRLQCEGTSSSFFLKQIGDNPVGLVVAGRHGADPVEWPEDLRVQEFYAPLSPSAEMLDDRPNLFGEETTDGPR